jgi:hypothetical protein
LLCDGPEWSNFTKYFAQNFQRLGLKKLISTRYAPDSKLYKKQLSSRVSAVEAGEQETINNKQCSHHNTKYTILNTKKQ